MKRARRIVLGAGALAGLVMLSGCADSYSRRQLVRVDPSPAMETLSERDADINNNLTVTVDENWRMMKSDFGRFWLMDRPSRLTREPMPR